MQKPLSCHSQLKARVGVGEEWQARRVVHAKGTRHRDECAKSNEIRI